MRTILLVALLALVGPAASSTAQVRESDRTPITDPDVLESLGFPRDARHVYRAKAIDAGPPREAPEDWGDDAHYTSVTPHDFMGRRSVAALPFEWDTDLFEGGLACQGGLCVVRGPIHLPTGVVIEAFRWWAVDMNLEDNIRIDVYEYCHPTSTAGPLVVTQLANGQTAGLSGDQSGVLAGGGYTVDNRDCYYEVELTFDGVVDLEFGKLRVQWSRQVSPPPALATFGDVPTNHPFFQHIEALAASGITAGCGGGNYCPDNPLTRGQMAAFLAIALGLYFP